MASSLPPGLSTPMNGQNSDISKRGPVVHSFDPDSSPAEKAAAAAKAQGQVSSVIKTADEGGKELTLDLGKGGPVPPKITVEDADAVSPDLPSAASSKQSTVPGALPDVPVHEIPDWFRVGWREVSEIDRPPLAEGEEKDRSVLESWIKEQYYGDWYHNAAVIFFAVASAHFLTLFGFGWGWLFLLLIACSSYYSTSMQRVRRRSRDDIQRELVKTRLVQEHETADWINNFLDRFWLIYEPVLSATVISSVDQILSTNTPPFLDSIRLSTFTLGSKAPRINHVRTYPNTAEDVVIMDWAVSFTPSDVSDITPAQAKNRVNPKIVLSIRVGKGFAGTTIPILLEDIEFSGEMMFRLKLMTNFPHVQVLDLSFKKPPVFDYVLKPIGGETLGFDIAHIPGLSAFIRDMVHATLGPMMYDPNMFTLNLEQMLSGAPLDAAIGVLQVSIHSARGLKGVKIGGGAPDPYVALSISQRAVLARTMWKGSTYNPSWNETKFLLINSLTDALVLSVLDHNDHRADGEMGAATIDLTQLSDDAVKEGIVSPVLKDGKDRGELRFDMSFYPVLKPQKLADGSEEPVPETKVGIVRLTIHQAKDLDHTKSMSGDLNPFARLFVGSSKEPIHITPRFKHTNNPIWESSTEFLCADKSSSAISVQVVDDRSLLKDPIVGFRAMLLNDLLEAKSDGRDWFPLNGCKSGRIRLSAEWKPLNMAGSLQGADQYTPPIGIVRLWIQKATDVKNVEAALGGKSDPYIRVLVNNITEGRTEVINNNLNPQWDQIIYIPVHSLRERMLLECMDYQHLTKDRSLGSTELRVSDLAEGNASNTQYPFSSTGKRERAEPLRLDKGNVYKGTLHYVAEFVPCLNLKGVEFDSQPNELVQAVTAEDDNDSDSSSSSSDHQTAEQMLQATAAQSSAPQNDVPITNGTTSKPAAEQVPPAEATDGVTLRKEELLDYQSGVIIFNVVRGTLFKKSRLEIMIDDGYWPSCATPKARSTHAQWNYVGEGFIKELDFSRIWLRLNENDENEKDSVIGELKINASEFMERSLDGTATFMLSDPDDERRQSTIEISARYVPVNIKLEPRESLNNQGVLRVELLDGKGLHAADRGGKSDPYALFTLNGDKVFKSQTKKKTLNPEWNETFTVQVSSRVSSIFTVEVFDWNQLEQAKSLGNTTVNLADLEPFQGLQQTLPLTHQKHGEKGEVRLNLTFQPEIVVKARKNTSTFSTAGRAVTQIGHVPFDGAKGVAHGVGTGASKVTGIFKKDHARQAPSVDTVPENPAPAGQISQPTKPDAPPTSFPAKNPALASQGAHPEPGMLKVTVFGAKDLSISSDIKPYVSLRVGEKEHKTKHQTKSPSPEWNESFTFPAGPDNGNLVIEVLDHRTFGKDKLLGDGTIDIWKHIQPVGATTADVWAELRDGQGLVRLRLEFERGPMLGRGASMASLDLNRTNNGSPTSSPSRFLSLRKKSEDLG